MAAPTWSRWGTTSPTCPGWRASGRSACCRASTPRRSPTRSPPTTWTGSSSRATRQASSSRRSRGRWPWQAGTGRGPVGVLPRARSERDRPPERAKAIDSLRGLRRTVQPGRAARRPPPCDPGHARYRRRDRRHPGCARDRRCAASRCYLVERTGDHRRPHGHVRQDLPHPRLRRLHPDAEDGGRRSAPDDRSDDLLRGRGRQRLARRVPASRCSANAPRASTSTPVWPATICGVVPDRASERVRCRDRHAQGDLHPIPAGGAQCLRLDEESCLVLPE